jgi:predicted transposase/invertase (TIGR01784 family)
MNKKQKKPRYKKSKEQLHAEDLERLHRFRPIDDTFMRSLFRDNAPLAQFVLRIIMEKPDLVLTDYETQADMKRVTGARSVCLDVYATDGAGKKYDIEVQRADKDAGAYRARYISSVMDVENLDEGSDFTDLPDTCVIFITENDYYKLGEPVYVIQNMNTTTSQLFGDGRYILYVNGENRDNTELGKLMHDFNCADPDEMYFKILADKTRYLKKSRKGVAEMCRVMDEMRDELRDEFYTEGVEVGMKKGKKEGKKEGRLEQARATAMKLKIKGSSIDEIADLVGYSESTVSKWLKTATANV